MQDGMGWEGNLECCNLICPDVVVVFVTLI